MCVVFLLAYLVFTYFLKMQPLYEDVGNVSVEKTLNTLLVFAHNDYIFLAGSLLVLARLTLVASGSTAFLPFWDSMLVGAAFFYMCNAVLGLRGPYSYPYYLAPGDYIVIVVAARILNRSAAKKLILPAALVLLLVLTPGTIQYAQKYRELSQEYRKVISTILALARSGHVTVHVARGSWPAQGVIAALKYHGLKVNSPDANAVIEGASEKIAEGNFMLVYFFSFWWSEQSQRSLLDCFFSNRDFRLVFPALPPDATIDPLKASFFQRV
jgi:hypothetical protein